jgi:hypothetical protein
MRPAIFSTENPPLPIDCLETKEYIHGLRRRIEVQNDQMECLAAQAQELLAKVEELSSGLRK